MGALMQDRMARYVALIERERETMEELAVRVAEGESLQAVCKAWDVPHGKFAQWVALDPRRQDTYDAARRIRADALADEMLAIADAGGEDTAHAALRAKVRQWCAGKWDRARYGDSVQVQHQGEVVVRLSFGAGASTTPAPAIVGQSSLVDTEGDI